MSTHERLSRLQDLLDARTRQLQDVAHELKNPLTVVSGYATYLLEADVTVLERQRALRAILSNTERLIGLADQLQTAARLESSARPLVPRPVDGAVLIQDAAASAEIEASRRRVRLSWRCPIGDALRVFVDPHAAGQVLANLIGNALKFTPAGGAVELDVQREDACARFTVSDSGPGVATADMPRLFERFYQADDETPKRRGLGLGLAICKELVEASGGRIWAESSPGAGARFCFTVPLAGVGVPR